MSNYYTDEQRVQIAKKEYSNLKLEKEVKIDGVNKTIGYVSQINDKSSGEQSFVITDHYVPPTAALAERETVKEVFVLYRGSTGLDKGKEQPVEVWQDWGVNDLEMAHQVIAVEQGTPPPHLRSSAETLKATMQLYPNA